MARYLLFNKPFHVLTQFTDKDADRKTLADFIDMEGVYSAGRLDYDSEGLLLLTDDGPLIHSMMNPKYKVPKTYLVQVEGDITAEALATLCSGVELKDGKTKPAKAVTAQEPEWLWPRTPPIRERKAIPTSWVEITLTEGKNRQVRRMTAAVGFPTLRLVRLRIGNLSVANIGVGEYQQVDLKTLEDNGIKKQIKKSSSKAASNTTLGIRQSDRRRRRSPHSRNQNRTT